MAGLLRGLQRRPTPMPYADQGDSGPLLDAFPALPVTAVDLLEHRVAMVQAVAAGGIDTLAALQADATALPFPPGAFDVVTALEMLEHIPDVAAAVREIARVARRHVVLSVPAHADQNQEQL